jgi:hypothetical protein
MERWEPAVWTAIGVILFGVAVVLFIALHQTKLDADYCPAARRQSGHFVLLVDETDAYAPGDADNLKQVVLDLRDRLPRYARLSVIAIGQHVEMPPLALFSLCNPGRKGQINPLIQTDRSKAVFDAPLDRLVASLQTEQTQPQSPILQTIAGVSRLPSFAKGERELDIVSDLLENSALLTQYHHPRAFLEFAASPDYAPAKADLKGVTVRLFYLARPETAAVQTDRQRQFWIEYFRASGASDVSWCSVQSATATRREVTCEPVSS